MNRNSFIPIFFLITISPFLSFVATNLGEPSFNYLVFIKITLVVFSAITICIILVSIFGAKLFKVSFSGMILAIATMFYLSFTYRSFTDVLSLASSYEKIIFVVGVILLGLLTYIVSQRQVILNAIGIFTATVILVPLLSIFNHVVFVNAGIHSELNNVQLPNIPPENLPTDPPNLYFLIPDAYGSEKSLLKYANIDISDFTDNIRNRGFFIANQSRAPYNMTYLSVASILHTEYFLNETSEEYDRSSAKNIYPRMMKQRTAPVAVQKFRDLGYKFLHYGNSWGPCIPLHVECPTQQAFRLPYEWMELLRSTPFTPAVAPLLSLFGIELQSVDNALQNLNLFLTKNGAPETPTVFFVHNLAPHPPYAYQNDCSLRSYHQLNFTSWEDDAKRLYETNLECVNSLIISLIDTIDSVDPDAMIVIVADHGTAFNGTQFYDERSSSFAAARLPEQCSTVLTRKVNSINLMRIALACASNSPPDLLDNVTYFGTYSVDDPRYGTVWRVPSE